MLVRLRRVNPKQRSGERVTALILAVTAHVHQSPFWWLQTPHKTKSKCLVSRQSSFFRRVWLKEQGFYEHTLNKEQRGGPWSIFVLSNLPIQDNLAFFQQVYTLWAQHFNDKIKAKFLWICHVASHCFTLTHELILSG